MRTDPVIMSERSPSGATGRVLVIVDSGRIDGRLIDTGARVAKRLSRALTVVFVENRALFDAAAFPFSREIGYLARELQAYSPDAVERSLRGHADRLRRQLGEVARSAGVHWSMTVRRGDYPSVGLSGVGPTDIVLSRVSVQAPVGSVVDERAVSRHPHPDFRIVRGHHDETTETLALTLRTAAGPVLWIGADLSVELGIAISEQA